MSRFSRKLSEEDEAAIAASESVVTHLAERSKRVKRGCWKRSIGDFFSAFSMGFFGGATLHFLKTVYFSPPGPERWISGVRAAIKHSPRMGVAFGMWGGIFSVCECLFKRVRGKKDASVTISAGAATGMILAFRHGPMGMVRGGLIGGILLGFIEGIVGIIHLASGGSDEEKELRELPLGQVSKKDFAEGILYYKFWRETVDTYGTQIDDDLVALARMTRRKYANQARGSKAEITARNLAAEKAAAENPAFTFEGGVASVDDHSTISQAAWLASLEKEAMDEASYGLRENMKRHRRMDVLLGGDGAKPIPFTDAAALDRVAKQIDEELALEPAQPPKPWDETFAKWFRSVRKNVKQMMTPLSPEEAAARAEQERYYKEIGAHTLEGLAKLKAAARVKEEAGAQLHADAHAAEGGNATFTRLMHQKSSPGSRLRDARAHDDDDDDDDKFKLDSVDAASYTVSKVENEERRAAVAEIERLRKIAAARDEMARFNAGELEAGAVGLNPKMNQKTSAWW